MPAAPRGGARSTSRARCLPPLFAPRCPLTVHVDIQDNVGIVTLDRPHRAHAYDRALLEALQAAVDGLRARVPVLLLQSTGHRAFCGGADLEALGQADPLDALDLLSQRVFDAIARSPVVSVCAVHGAAVAGGFELALACDLRVVGPAARFQLPETGIGLIPAAGGCTRLPRLVGPSVAKQLILAGQSLDAEAAVHHGLAMGPEPDCRAAARALCDQLQARDPVALRLAKGIIDRDTGAGSLADERVAEALLYARRQA